MTAGGFAALRSKEIRGPALGCWISLDGFSAFPAECAQKSARPRARRVGNHAANPSIVRFKHELEFYFLPRSNVVPRSIPNTSCREQDITRVIGLHMNVHVSMCRCTGLPGTDEQLVDQERSPNGQFLFVTIFHLVRPRRRQEVHELLRVCREEE